MSGEQNGLTPEMSSVVFLTASFEPSKFYSDDIGRLAKIAERADIAWVNCPVDEVRKEAMDLGGTFGFHPNLVRTLLEGRYASFLDNGTQVGIMLPSVQIDKGSIHPRPVLMLVKDRLILTIQDRRITRFAYFARYAESYLKRIPAGWGRSDKLTAILIRLMDENNDRNYRGLQGMGSEIDRLGQLLAREELGIQKIAQRTYALRHAMVVFLSVLWENRDVLDDLHHGDVSLLSSREELIDRLTKMTDENSQYIQLGENLANLLGSGSEAMQDYYAIRLIRFNNMLSFVSTWMAVLGTMFLVPNTFATAMAASAFKLGPGDMLWYSAFLVALTIASCAGVYYLINKFWRFTFAEAVEKGVMRTHILNGQRFSLLSQRPDKEGASK